MKNERLQKDFERDQNTNFAVFFVDELWRE